jgi:membrane protein insertase Oxa1/YidC/SpoIIIJ
MWFASRNHPMALDAAERAPSTASLANIPEVSALSAPLPITDIQFLHLGVWSIIMGISMWVQMKLNSTPPDPAQAVIFNWMPIIFTFMLANFPAGLVIYWAWNNTLSRDSAERDHAQARRQDRAVRQH